MHVQLPIKVWFCFSRRQENVAFCLKCLEGCNFCYDQCFFDAVKSEWLVLMSRIRGVS